MDRQHLQSLLGEETQNRTFFSCKRTGGLEEREVKATNIFIIVFAIFYLISIVLNIIISSVQVIQ